MSLLVQLKEPDLSVNVINGCVPVLFQCLNCQVITKTKHNLPYGRHHINCAFLLPTFQIMFSMTKLPQGLKNRAISRQWFCASDWKVISSNPWIARNPLLDI